MFQNPLLHKLELLYKASSAPKRGLRSGRFAKFHAAIRAGLKISDKKKIAEAVHLILFAMHYPDFPDGALATGEEPDFLLTALNRTIGIEHTQVFVQRSGKNSLKAQESIQDRIVERAFNLYQQSNKPPVMISCAFLDNTNYRDRDVEDLAQQLAAAVPSNLAKRKEWTSFESYDAGTKWIPGMLLIQGRAPAIYEPTEGRWGVSHGGVVYSSEPFIQAALDSKEKKLSRYRKQQPNCDEFWLLLVVEGFTASSFMTMPDLEHVFTSSFNRAFIFNLSDKTMTEVRRGTSPTILP